jgi:hypothetical protein
LDVILRSADHRVRMDTYHYEEIMMTCHLELVEINSFHPRLEMKTRHAWKAYCCDMYGHGSSSACVLVEREEE